MSVKIYKRGNLWWLSGTVAGKRFRESTRTADKKMAEQIAAKRHWELGHAAVHGPETIVTFGAAVAMYLDARRDDRFLLPIFERLEHIKLKEITPGMIRSLAQRIYPKASAATWNRQVITPARAVINHAADQGFCHSIRVKTFPVKKSTRRAVSREWISAFVSAAPENLAALCLFMFTTGARIGEAVALEWRDVNMIAKTARLRDTKNGEDRVAHLTASMLRLLSTTPKTPRKVFGYPSRHSVYGPWGRACQAAGIEYVPPHQAGRHSFATEMIVRSGVDVATTAEAGGWKSKRLLVDTYVHGERHREAVDAVFEDISGRPERETAKVS